MKNIEIGIPSIILQNIPKNIKQLYYQAFLYNPPFNINDHSNYIYKIEKYYDSKKNESYKEEIYENKIYNRKIKIIYKNNNKMIFIYDNNNLISYQYLPSNEIF